MVWRGQLLISQLVSDWCSWWKPSWSCKSCKIYFYNGAVKQYINSNTVHAEKVFISSKILTFLYFWLNLSDSPLNFSPEKLYHTIWFIISKIDIFCWEWENNRYRTLTVVLTFFLHEYHEWLKVLQLTLFCQNISWL